MMIVNIDVFDVNDNVFVFFRGNYSVIIQENKLVGFSVLQLVVIDEDFFYNGLFFVFIIVIGNDDKVFEVNQ